MNDLSNTNCIPSGMTQAKLDRERVEQLNIQLNELSDRESVPCGLKNPCVFGKHNKNFNPKNI